MTSHLNISQGEVKGYIEILRKQNSLFSSGPVIKHRLLKISNRNLQAGSSLLIIGWYSYQKYKVLLKYSVYVALKSTKVLHFKASTFITKGTSL